MRRAPEPGHEHINLGSAGEWYLDVPKEPDADGRKQGFVFRPDGKDSASLNAALGLGQLTGDFETEIPGDVLHDLECHKEEYS